MTRRQWIGLAVALIAFAVPWVVEFEGLSVEGHRIFSVFLLAIVLWVTEAVPLHATAVLIILLEILFVSDRAILPTPEGFEPPAYSSFYHTMASPILMLFLGGFFLAVGASKYDLDRNLARVLLRPFGTSPRAIVLGLMLITGLFSMFMSNTATTATMIAVVLPVIASLPPDDGRRVALALCIPVAANVGGMATPIGTPPNAIALGALMRMKTEELAPIGVDAPIQIGFAKWMAMLLPFSLVLMFLAWVFLLAVYRGPTKRIEIGGDSRFDRSRPAVIFYVVFAATVVLWLTESLHGVKSTVVGFVPVVALLLTRVFTVEDMKQVQWHVLWLVAGGIALGLGVGACGLDAWLIGLVEWKGMSSFVVIALLGLIALAFSTFISNSATANLLVPIGLTMCSSGAVQRHPILVGAIVAVGCSLAMALPISTPPNAIALSTGAAKTRDMVLVGGFVGLVGWLAITLLAPWYWAFIGAIPK